MFGEHWHQSVNREKEICLRVLVSSIYRSDGEWIYKNVWCTYVKSYSFVYGTYIKKICEWGPVYIEKNFPGVTLPALVNLSKCLYEKQWPLYPSWKKRSCMLWFSLLDRVNDPAEQVKCLLGEKLASLERWHLPSKKGSSRAHYLQVSSVIKRQVSVRKC